MRRRGMLLRERDPFSKLGDAFDHNRTSEPVIETHASAQPQVNKS